MLETVQRKFNSTDPAAHIKRSSPSLPELLASPRASSPLQRKKKQCNSSGRIDFSFP